MARYAQAEVEQVRFPTKRPSSEKSYHTIAARCYPANQVSSSFLDKHLDNRGPQLWLRVDCAIRELSKEQASLDDFCRDFFAAHPDHGRSKGFDLEELVAALNAVAPGPWRELINRRVYRPQPDLSLDALQLAGYQLRAGPRQSAYLRTHGELYDSVHALDSLGICTDRKGGIDRILEDSITSEAGMRTSTRILAVSRRAFSPASLTAVIRASVDSTAIAYIVKDGADFSVHKLSYDQGLKHPAMERRNGNPDRLRMIMEPLAGEDSPPDASAKSSIQRQAVDPQPRATTSKL